MIPQQDINIIPQNQYNKLINLFDKIYNDWIIDQDEIRKKYFVMFFKMIRKEIENLFKDNNFWIIYSLDKNRCDYIGKNGRICNSKIHIKYEKRKHGWRCYEHISKTIYNSNRQEKNPDRICIGQRKYGRNMIPCKELKMKNSNYCRHHNKPIYNPDINESYFKYYFNKLLFEDILEEHKLFLNNIQLKNEIKLFHNINYDNKHYNIDFINIRYNSRICLYQNDNMSFTCNNLLFGEEVYCVSCLKKKNNDNDSLLTYYNNSDLMSEIDLYDENDQENNIYYNDNRIKKKRKIYDKITTPYVLGYENNLNKLKKSKHFVFSFNYSIYKYKLNNLKINNRLLLNEILEYIIDIRNYIYEIDNYKNNEYLLYILGFTNKIIDII